MKVKEMRDLITSLKSEGKLNGQTVEFVLNAKKFFASDVKAGTNTMACQITRNNFHPLSVDSFESSLKQASGDLEVLIFEGKSQKSITESFLTDSTLELVVE